MKSDKKHIIVYTFQSLEDPLVKGLMLQYLLALGKSGDKCFHLITHEQPSFQLSEEDKKSKKEFLRDHCVEWYPVNYHNGKFLVIKKAFDFLKTAFICFHIKWKFKPKWMLGFLPLAAGFCSILAPILRLKLITYCFEPHSEYMVDFGTWHRKDLRYVLLKKYELNQIELSGYIVVPTRHTLEMVNRINPVSKKFLLPISVDTGKNVFDADARNSIRKNFAFDDKYTFLYMGKFDGIYYSVKELVDFIYRFRNLGNYHFMVISDAAVKVNEYIDSSGMDKSFFTVFNYVPYDKLNQYISAADMGIIAVPPLPSQKYRTPVKTSLYLSCGIPYLINKGIAEDDELALKHGIGVVTDDFAVDSTIQLNQQIQQLRQIKGAELAERCRRFAVENRSHELAVELLSSVWTGK